MRITDEKSANRVLLRTARLDREAWGVPAGPGRDALMAERARLTVALDEYDRVHNPHRKGAWIWMRSGRRFWPFSPLPEDIDATDIASNLSNLCRFCGRVRRFYSVAQHSVLVSLEADPGAALEALLHDAGEAYLGDVIAPVKRRLPEFMEAERRIMDAVRQRFGLSADPAVWAEVRRADDALLSAEFRDVAGGVRQGVPRQPAAAARVVPWGPTRAMGEFSARLDRLLTERAGRGRDAN